MSRLREQVIEFHRANNCPGTGLGPPGVPSPERVALRADLVAEEFFEFLVGLGVNANDLNEQVNEVRNMIDFYVRRRGAGKFQGDVNIVDVADALADLDYVIEGTRLEFGIDGGPIADEVHRSNMSKLGADGKPVRREDGKILKGPNYEPPDIEGELRKQGWTP